MSSHNEQPASNGYKWRNSAGMGGINKSMLYNPDTGRVYALVLVDREPHEVIMFLPEGKEERHFFIDLSHSQKFAEHRTACLKECY